MVQQPSYRGRYRAAILGHTGRGNYGHRLDTAATGLPRVEVVAVADPDPQGREAARQRSGAARSYAGHQELLEAEKPDLVVVAPDWLDQRVAMITAACRAGARAIYCEKPLARTPAEADEIRKACEQAGVQLAVAHQNRAFPAPYLAQKLVQQGKIGRLRQIRASTKNDSRGGALEYLIHGTHLFDLMLLFAGPARWCDGRVGDHGADATPMDLHDGPMGAGRLVGDDVWGVYGFDHGVIGELQSFRGGDGGGSDYLHLQLWGTDGTLSFWSDLRSPVWHSRRPYPLLHKPDSGELLQPEIPGWLLPDPAVNPLHAGNQVLVADLLTAVETGREPLASGRNAAAAVEMIAAATLSHFTRRRERFPLRDRTGAGVSNR